MAEAAAERLRAALANPKTPGEAFPRPLALPKAPAERLWRSRRSLSACLHPFRPALEQPIPPPERFPAPLALPSAPARPPLPAARQARADHPTFILKLTNVSGGPATL